MIKKAHIFHHNDMDGRFAAFYMYQYLKKYERAYRKTEFYEINYSQEIDLDPINESDLIIFLDYSFSNQHNLFALQRAVKAGKRIIWIDHHNTSIKALDALHRDPYGECDMGNLDTYFDNVHSATKLVYFWCLSRINKKPGQADLFANSNVPPLVQYVNAYDMWNHFSVYKCREFSYGLEATKYNPKSLYSDIFGADTKYNIFDDADDDMNKKIAAWIENKIKMGEVISLDRDSTYRSWIDAMAFKVSIHDNVNDVHLNGIVMNVSSNSLAFLDLYDTYDFVSPYYQTKDGLWKYSFFSHNKSAKLDYYAEILGKSTEVGGISGGGHPSAAGAVLGTCIYRPNCRITFDQTSFTKRIKVRIE